MHDTIAEHSLSDRMRGLISLMRPKQWVKNAFVLAPVLFSGEFLDAGATGRALAATVLFCLASSSSYIVNDMHDIEGDRQHPKKSKTRPLASGIVPVPAAALLLAFLYVMLGCGWLFVNSSVIIVIAVYLALNLAYTFFLKHQPVVDIFTIAIGFVLRVYAGAMAISVSVSAWMFVTTLCLALYLASVKRQQELKFSGSKGRRVLEKYSDALINRYAEMSATGALVFYSLFVMSSKPDLVITIPLVLFGLYRYWYVVEELDAGESPTDALLADLQLLLSVIFWVVACGWALWPAQE